MNFLNESINVSTSGKIFTLVGKPDSTCKNMCSHYWEDRFPLLGNQSLNVINYVSGSVNTTVFPITIHFSTSGKIFPKINGKTGKSLLQKQYVSLLVGRLVCTTPKPVSYTGNTSDLITIAINVSTSGEICIH